MKKGTTNKLYYSWEKEGAVAGKIENIEFFDSRPTLFISNEAHTGPLDENLKASG